MAKTSTMPARVHSTSTVDGETTGLCFGTHPKQKLSQVTMIVNSPARRARYVLKISGKRFSRLLVRALAMAPAGPQTENTPGKSRQGPGKLGGSRMPELVGAVFRTPNSASGAPPKGPKGAPRGPEHEDQWVASRRMARRQSQEASR